MVPGCRVAAIQSLTAIAAATEPAIPALLQPLLDRGFTGRELPLLIARPAGVRLLLLLLRRRGGGGRG